MKAQRRKSDWPTAREWYFGMPGPIRRLLWWWTIPLGLVTVEMGFLIFWPSRLFWLQRNVGWPFQFIFVIAQVSVMLFVGLASRRIQRAFRASGGRLCTNCAHSLAGLADIGKCPECGEPFHIEFDRLTWKKSGMTVRKDEPF